MARLLAPKHAEALGQPVVVENKPGASGQIAAQQVARAAPDGSQLLFDASSFAVNPSLFPKLPYDTDAAFVAARGGRAVPQRDGLHARLRGEDRRRRDPAREGESRQDRLRVVGQRLGAAPRGRALRAARRRRAAARPYRGGGPALND